MFRFTIRDVLWLTVVVALAVAWCSDRVQTLRRVAKAEAALVLAQARNEEQAAELQRIEYSYFGLRRTYDASQWQHAIEAAKSVGTYGRGFSSTEEQTRLVPAE